MAGLLGTGKIAEDPAACSAIVREVGAIQQLILMALSENEVVVQQACKTMGEQPLVKLAGIQMLPFTLPHLFHPNAIRSRRRRRTAVCNL